MEIALLDTLRDAAKGTVTRCLYIRITLGEAIDAQLIKDEISGIGRYPVRIRPGEGSRVVDYGIIEMEVIRQLPSIGIDDMTIRKRTLEDVFIALTGRGLRE